MNEKRVNTIGRIQNKLNEVRKNPFFKTMAIIVVLLFLFFIIVTQTISIVRLKFQMGNMTDTMNDLKNENKVLVERMEQAKTDKTIEEVARERLGMVRTGETPIKIYEKTEPSYTVETIDSQDKFGIYMMDWYKDLEDKIEEMKNK